MADQFLGEIRIVPFNFAPQGWAMCNGQLIPIIQNTALFSLLGTQYGGNGTSTFGLPDFQSRSPRGQGQGPGLQDVIIGENGGEEAVTLQSFEIPSHSHAVLGVSSAGERDPRGHMWAPSTGALRFGPPSATTMDPAAISSFGSPGPHDNLPPYLVLNFIIALQGIFPARN